MSSAGPVMSASTSDVQTSAVPGGSVPSGQSPSSTTHISGGSEVGPTGSVGASPSSAPSPPSAPSAPSARRGASGLSVAARLRVRVVDDLAGVRLAAADEHGQDGGGQDRGTQLHLESPRDR